MRELVPSDIITEKLLRDGSLKVTEVEVEDALESMITAHRAALIIHTKMLMHSQDLPSRRVLSVCHVCVCVLPLKE